MAIEGDYWLIDTETGTVFGADSTVVVPEVHGELAYDILYDAESAIEYGEDQGVELDAPGAEGLPLEDLEAEPRGYLAVDLDNGNVARASSLRLIDADLEAEDMPDPDAAVALAENGTVPVVSVEVLEVEGLPFESVSD